MVNKQKNKQLGGEQTVGLEQPPGTVKDPFLVIVDQIWLLECNSDDHHTSEDQETAVKRCFTF